MPAAEKVELSIGFEKRSDGVQMTLRCPAESAEALYEYLREKHAGDDLPPQVAELMDAIWIGIEVDLPVLDEPIPTT